MKWDINSIIIKETFKNLLILANYHAEEWKKEKLDHFYLGTTFTQTILLGYSILWHHTKNISCNKTVLFSNITEGIVL